MSGKLPKDRLAQVGVLIVLSHGRTWLKAPARLVVSRTRVSREVFNQEWPERGDTHFDYQGVCDWYSEWGHFKSVRPLR